MATDDNDVKLSALSQADFLAPGLIHEMRHPLMGIKAGVQFLEGELGAAVKNREEWKIVVAQLQRLEELFTGYQQFLHPEQLTTTDFDANEVAARAVELLTFRLRPLGDRFLFTRGEGSARAHGVPSGVLHAVINLLANALDALSAAATGRLQLRVLARPAGVELRVSDQGTGITAENARRIFEPHFTTKQHGSGSGLGLPISRRMVTAGGGTLEVSLPGDPDRLSWAKTEFVIRLRTWRAPAVKAAPRPSAEAPLRGRTALIVDDEEVVLFVLRRALTRLGMEFTACGSAEGAEKELQHRPFDFLITDKNLPGMNGIQLAERARAAYPDIAVVMITGYGSAESAAAALELGVDEYLLKPFLPEDLGPRLSEVLARRSAAKLAGPVSAKNVAVVEKCAPELMVLRRALSKIGLTPLAGGELAAALKSQADALVVAVAELSEADRQAVRAWRRERRPVAIVAVCEEGSLADAMTAITVGATAQLSRALTGPELEAALGRALSGRRSR